MLDSIMNLDLMNISGAWLVFIGLGFFNLLTGFVFMYENRRRKILKRLYDSRSDSQRTQRLTVYEPNHKWDIIKKESTK